MQKTVCQLDALGYYVGPAYADPCQLDAGAWIIPGGAVDAAPPAVPEGQRARYDGAGGWVFEAAAPAEEPPVPAPPTAAPISDEIVNQTQMRLDSFARLRGYDSILSACTYALSMDARFAAEGLYCVGVRDATWVAVRSILAAVEAGEREYPDTYDEIEGELPALSWPV